MAKQFFSRNKIKTRRIDLGFFFYPRVNIKTGSLSIKHPFDVACRRLKKSLVEDDPRLSGGRRGAVFLENAQEVLLFLVGLEAAVAELGSRIDQGQPDLFGGGPLGLREERLADVEDALPDADARTFEHDEVLLHHTVMRETSHRIDRLLRNVLLRHSVVRDELAVLHVESVSDAVDLLINFRSGMVTLLSDASHRIGDARRMPRADTSHFAETFVR